MIWINSDHQMDTVDKSIKIDSTAGPLIVTLPPLIDAVELFFYIEVADYLNHIILNIKETDQPIGVLSGKGKFMLLYCPGEDWKIITTNTY